MDKFVQRRPPATSRLGVQPNAGVTKQTPKRRSMVELASSQLAFSRLDFIETHAQRKHWSQCRIRRQCRLCRYIIFKNKWKQFFTLTPPNVDVDLLSAQSQQMAKGSWLDVKWEPSTDTDAPSPMLGCTVCSQSLNPRASSTPLGSFSLAATQRGLRLIDLCRHTESDVHQKALLEFLQIATGPTSRSVEGAPSISDFLAVWDALCKGQRTVDSVGQYERLKKLQWCLWEAIKEQDRKFLLTNGVVVTLLRDERQGRIALRFIAVDQHMEVKRGILGQTKIFGTGAEEINRATKHVVESLMTKCLHPPRGCLAAVSDAERTEAQAHAATVLGNVKVLTVDAASDELTAGRTGRAGSDGITPNLALVIRDKTHASRRTVIAVWSSIVWCHSCLSLRAPSRALWCLSLCISRAQVS